MKKIKIRAIWFLVSGFWFLVPGNCFAEKITILYTGQTHAALYHCSCPKEPDGGIARRMTLIKQLRLENPHLLLLDSGGFFAGGMLDEHSQGLELDKIRNEINLKSLELMGYDALAIGDDELNFGKDYLLGEVKKYKLPFLSVNLKLEGLRPYVIKKTADTNIAIIGLSNEQARVKASGLELEDAKAAVLRTIQEVKKNKVDLILALSYLGEEKDKELLNEVQDIDILISGRPIESPDNYTQIGSSYLVRPSWQGRRLGRMDLELENHKIKELKLEQIRLSSEIADAPEIVRILPRCFADTDCLESGLRGRCNSSAKLDASCSYDKPRQLSLLIIRPKDTQILYQEQFISFLKNLFPGIETKSIDYSSGEGKSWVEKLKPKLLPVYLLAKEADKEAGFKNIREFVELKEDYYYLKPSLAGGSIFVGRKMIPKHLDVFLGSTGKYREGILAVLRQLTAKHKGLRVGIHYLAVEGPEGFSAPGGRPELEEDIRQVCLKAYEPDKFWDYALCRARNQESTWWETCAEQYTIDAQKIKKCALSEEGVSLLRENTKLNKELEIAGGPTFLIDNYIVFSLSGVPTLEALEKIMRIGD